ncbi:MAG: hypothetical protein ACI9GW_002601, partial [Halieaceae bacterium]
MKEEMREELTQLQQRLQNTLDEARSEA